MNERQLWSTHIKPRWHKPDLQWVAWKVEDKFFSGAPDADCCFSGVACKVELKYDNKLPAREDTACWFSYLNKEKTVKTIVSAGQWNYLDQWHNAGGLAFVLIVVGKEWVLLEQGTYTNEPQPWGSLIELSKMYSGAFQRNYESLSTIPPFIMEHYAGRFNEFTEL